MSSPAKPTLFPGISATETRLLVLANVCLKNDKLTVKVDYDKLAANAGIKASSAHTLFRTAKRKLDKLYADGHANADGASPTMTPEDSSSKHGKANGKAPRTIKSPKTPKSPNTPKSAKATKGDKAGIKSEAADDQDVHVKLEFSPLTADFDLAAALAEDTTRKATIATPEPVTETTAAESLTEPATTADAIQPKTEKEHAKVKSDEKNDAVLELAVNQQLPESPLPDEEGDAYKQEKAQENGQLED
ncbi:unnamed protein product [Penicillium palitans]